MDRGLFERMTYIELLKDYIPLQNRVEKANTKLVQIRDELYENALFEKWPMTVYCAGSLGRGDVGKLSDLDLFILSEEEDKKIGRLDEVEVLATVIDINRKLGYQEFSNDGQYLKVYSRKEMLKAVGDPRDDSENLFTARMLMLLESRPVCNELIFEEYLDSVIQHYFRDSRGKRSFRPLFLINDILRYWRTLCLNYERIRDDPAKPWRKKNINLKFSRMLTVFGTILPIVAKPVTTPECVKELTEKNPQERFAYGLDQLGDDSMEEKYKIFLENYESFLTWKENYGSQAQLNDDVLDMESRKIALDFSDFIYEILQHPEIDSEFKKYLVI